MTKNISNAMLEHSVCIMLGFLSPFQYVGVVTLVIEICTLTMVMVPLILLLCERCKSKRMW